VRRANLRPIPGATSDKVGSDSLGGYYRELLPTAAIPWGVLNKEKPGYPPTGG